MEQSQGGVGKLIVVLGMHRSGTSAITRALVALGVDLGDRLQEGIAGNNDKGFFEDKDLVALNDDLLGAVGAKWDTVGPIDLTQIPSPALGELQLRAIELLRSKCPGRTTGFKDPRLCRLLPFWRPVFDYVGLDVRYVIAVRNPVSVAQSLAKRDDMEHGKSYLLWLGHVVPALADTHGCVRTLVDYDRLLDEPSVQLQRMASQLGTLLDASEVEIFAQTFVEEGLRHTRFGAQELDAAAAAPGPLKRLYAALDEACRGFGPTSALDQALPGAAQFLADVASLLSGAWQRPESGGQEAGTQDSRDRQIQELGDALAERDSRIAALERAAALNGSSLPAAPFFPNQPESILQLEAIYRREVERLPQQSRLILYSIFSSSVPGLVGTRFGVHDGMVLATQNRRELAFPDPLPMDEFRHIACGYEQWQERQYCLPGFVEVEWDDIVVDCGAFVGGFALGAAKRASQVHLFEPVHEHFVCAQRNVNGVQNVVANEAGLHPLAAGAARDARRRAGKGGTAAHKVQVTSLGDYLAEKGIAKLDFMKISAGGAEQDVLNGFGDVRPRKLAIDVGGKVHGQSSPDVVANRVMAMGYDVRVRGDVIFAKLNG
jgi:FkbM family methyltransferase